MYDLVSHLIYLDNFSEEKTNKASLGGRHSLPSPHPQFSSYFQGLPGSALQRVRRSPPPPQEPASGVRRVCSPSGAHAPPRGVKLINFIMVVSSLMFFFAMSRL